MNSLLIKLNRQACRAFCLRIPLDDHIPLCNVAGDFAVEEFVRSYAPTLYEAGIPNNLTLWQLACYIDTGELPDERSSQGK